MIFLKVILTLISNSSNSLYWYFIIDHATKKHFRFVIVGNTS